MISGTFHLRYMQYRLKVLGLSKGKDTLILSQDLVSISMLLQESRELPPKRTRHNQISMTQTKFSHTILLYFCPENLGTGKTLIQ